MIAALVGTVLLNSSEIGVNLGWRLALLVGPALGAVVWFVRRTLPESPRWLITHGRAEEAERNIAEIEARVRSSGHQLPQVSEDRTIDIDTTKQRASLLTVARVLFRDYPKRSLLGAALMITQSFLYNAFFSATPRYWSPSSECTTPRCTTWRSPSGTSAGRWHWARCSTSWAGGS
jgi:MFS family permease